MTTPAELSSADKALAAALIEVPGVRAVFLGGSRATMQADATSDTDLYALFGPDLAGRSGRHAALEAVADDGVVHEETAWGLEDHLRHEGQRIEVIYWPADGVLDEYYDPGVQPTGYTTAVLHTLAAGVPLADPDRVLAGLQGRLRTYPEATRERILLQMPAELASYLAQVRKAQQRRDWTNVGNRRAAFADAWFDLIFALNRVYHPGEKRQLTYLGTLPIQPDAAVDRWITVALLPGDAPELPDLCAGLADDLIELLDA